MMKSLASIPTTWRFKEDFRRIGDLVHFEGPELVVFEHLDTGQIFVFDWVDHDHTHNRWLILEVLATDLLEFIYRKITHLELFRRAMGRDTYVLDIDNQKGFSRLPVLQVMEIPMEYQANDVLFDQDLCPDHARISAYLRRRVSSEKQENRIPVLSKAAHENLLLDNKVYKPNILANTARIRVTYVKWHLPVPSNELDPKQIDAAFEDNWLISAIMNANLKLYGLANAC